MLSRLQSFFDNPMYLFYTIPGILIGFTVHEWAHAYSAYRLGDPTARNLGRMTLNPLKHVDWLGILMLLVLGFGWARPVPVNPRNFKNYRRDDIIVSLAGITMNLVIAFLGTVVFYLGILRLELGSNEAFYQIFLSIVSINLSLAVFNLLPIYPLDGSHVVESLFYRRAPQLFNFLRQYGQYLLIVLLVTRVLSGILSWATGLLFQLFSRGAIALVTLF